MKRIFSLKSVVYGLIALPGCARELKGIRGEIIDICYLRYILMI